MPPMKIIHLTPYYAPAYAFGGVVRAVEGLAQALHQRSHQVTVLTTDAYDQQRRYDGPSQETLDGVDVLRARNALTWLRGRFNLATPIGLHWLAEQVLSDADVLHVHEWRTVENLRVLPVAAKLGVPVVMSPHGTLGYATGRGGLKSTWDRYLSAGLAQHIRTIVALTENESEEARQLWQSLGPVPHIQVVPNGITLSDFENMPKSVDFRRQYKLGRGPVVLFMGRLHARKGVAELVEAFRLLDRPDARLVIAGPDEGMRNQIMPRLDERMVLTGYLDGVNRLKALAAADLFVLPATGEGLSMAVLEAMAASVPVLLSPGCNLPDVQPAGAGWIVDPDPSALAQALTQILADPDRLQAMGTAARQFVASRYTWDVVAEQMEQVYLGVLG